MSAIKTRQRRRQQKSKTAKNIYVRYQNSPTATTAKIENCQKHICPLLKLANGDDSKNRKLPKTYMSAIKTRQRRRQQKSKTAKNIYVFGSFRFLLSSPLASFNSGHICFWQFSIFAVVAVGEF